MTLIAPPLPAVRSIVRLSIATQRTLQANEEDCRFWLTALHIERRETMLEAFSSRAQPDTPLCIILQQVRSESSNLDGKTAIVNFRSSVTAYAILSSDGQKIAIVCNNSSIKVSSVSNSLRNNSLLVMRNTEHLLWVIGTRPGLNNATLTICNMVMQYYN